MKIEQKRYERVHPLISCTPGVVGGAPAIDGIRIRVADVVAQMRLAEEEGRNGIEYVLEGYAHISGEQVEAALRYYDGHRQDIDEYMKRGQAILDNWTPFRAVGIR